MGTARAVATRAARRTNPRRITPRAVRLTAQSLPADRSTARSTRLFSRDERTPPMRTSMGADSSPRPPQSRQTAPWPPVAQGRRRGCRASARRPFRPPPRPRTAHQPRSPVLWVRSSERSRRALRSVVGCCRRHVRHTGEEHPAPQPATPSRIVFAPRQGPDQGDGARLSLRRELPRGAVQSWVIFMRSSVPSEARERIPTIDCAGVSMRCRRAPHDR